jgi:PAS domain S-box-containing protein
MHGPFSRSPAAATALAAYAVAVFVADARLPLGVAGALLYVAMPVFASAMPWRRAIEVATFVAIALTLAGIPLKPSWAPGYVVFLNRALICVTLGAVSAVLIHRRQLARRFRDSSDQFRTIVTTAKDGIITIDAAGQMRLFNPAAEKMFGYRAEEVLGRNVSLLMPEPRASQHDGYLARYLGGGEPHVIGIGCEVEGLRKDGSRIPIELSIGEIPGAETRAFAAVLRDLTNRRAAEERVRRAAQFESLVLATTSNLMGLPLEHLDEGIERVLELTCEFLGADLARIGIFDERAGRMTVTHRWYPEKSRVRFEVGELEARAFQWETARLAEGEEIVIRRLDDFPKEDRAGRQFFEHVGAQAGLAYPLRLPTETSAFFAVLSAEPRDWSETEITSTRAVAGVVAGAIERRRRESDLQTLKRAIHETEDHVLITDREGRIEYANPAFERKSGYRLEEIRGQTPRLLRSDRHPASFYEKLWQTILLGRVFRGEFVNRKKNGELYLEEKVIAPIRDADGAITHFVSTGRDITARREAEQELERSREALLEAQRIAQLGNWDWDAQGDDIVWSEEVYRIFGVDSRTFRPTYSSFLAAVHPDDRGAVEAAVQQALTERRPYAIKHRILRPDGSMRWLEENGEARYDKARLPVRMIGTVQDITEQKIAEERQAELGEKLKRIAQEWRFTFDAIEFPAVLLDRDLTVRRINVAASRSLGRTPQECIARRFDELSETEPCLTCAELARQVSASHEGRSGQVRDGDARTWEIHASWYRDDAGEREWIVLTARDLTETTRLRESLEQGRLMSTMGALVSGVAHEVRNPLFGISATLDALEELHGREVELAEFLTVMRQQVHRLSNLMQDLLVYGRPAETARQSTAVGDLLDEAIAMNVALASECGVAVVRQIAEDLPELPVDAPRVVLALRNVLDNALRFTPRGATIRASAARESSPAGELVRIDIEDEGSGFPAADLSHVFEPFFTRRRAGTGLGLSIVERCMAQHGGSATAGNRPAGGAIVTLRIPVEPPSAPETKEA